MHIVLLSTSCTKFANPEPQFDEYNDIADTTVKRKVLIIAVDGLVGSQVKIYKPTNIGKMMEHAKYSYETKADDNTNGYASWATLLTGYKSYDHKITKESFMVDIDLKKEHASYDFTPSLFYRLERADLKIRTASVVQNATMNAMLLANADTNAVVDSDAKVEKELLNLINIQKTDLLIGQFKGLVNAGVDGGFLISNAKYKSALDQIDAYIGNIVSGIEKRKNYNKEKWLIIVCSPQGGTSVGKYGESSLDEINTFSMYYNKSFLSKEIRAESMSYLHANGYFPGTYYPYDDVSLNRPRAVTSLGVRAQSPTGIVSNVFNASNNASKSITYEFKINFLNEGFWRASADYRSTFLLGKDLDDKVETKGWSYSTGSSGEHRLIFQNGADSENVDFVKNTGGWNHIVFTLKELTSNSIAVEIYENGVRKANTTINMGLSSFENLDPLNVGFTPISSIYSFPNFQISNFRVWNKVLTDAEIKQLACQNSISSSDALSNSLIANYQFFSIDHRWLNAANTSAPDLMLSGAGTNRITRFYSLCEPNLDEIYAETVDVLPQVFYWFNLKLAEDNKLAGKEFLTRFLEEFWRD
ncbi:LamG-like jellyroll fold domain-containing protein [Sphingobacterium bovistauri]|uniref:Type I phosphodiesterase / nucleotide pyrophosphatase n=1 Tax=Sphingobacterium bovistauri TaxID=2781959 RepID=A0ABS7Z6W9_9SPHI|nr:LamG-like jellyroll fold domain-containing protein [Sphingobacterium bovistauri]MCA5005908.1 hypothetical protein [Sphingobacterium bovistauri]